MEMINIADFNIIFFSLFSQLFISMIHEISHLYVYQSEINMKTVNIGFSLRYLFIPLFFITVPFMNFFNKNKKLYLMSAGIKSQIVLLGIGCFLSILNNNVYLYVFNLVNINLLIVNSIPFLKMDGYWMISTILSTDDYMKEYFSFFKNKKKVSNKILIIGTINLVLIILTVSYNLILLVRYLI
ncbi:hypothetical protein [Carnobacterium gallinarum]|uniref:hypothetical protein n=1 Tax=Carnobacterium gallinarum TaxID=2749 RepID=UPI0014702B9B|nr:hypothetical protein [Carnobacterium gallinarum]